MDRSEGFARVHLHHRGFDDVVFEPSPNEPPDFLINGKIAVEVRRLNQNFIASSGNSEFSRPFHTWPKINRTIEAALREFAVFLERMQRC